MDSEKVQTLEQEPSTAPDPVAQPELGSDVGADFAALTAERDRLAAEKSDLADQLLRARAEFENFRRRSDREKLDTLEYAAMDTLRGLLPVLDDFQRALAVESGDREFQKGMELIRQRMIELMKKQGLEPIAALGAQFDPNLHEAIERVDTTEAEEDTVVAELQSGYRFKGRLLRPALVKVAVRS